MGLKNTKESILEFSNEFDSIQSNKTTASVKTNDPSEKFKYLIGRKYNEQYQIEEFLGQGSFGTVFKVKDLKDIYEPIKAIKIISNKYETDALKEIDTLKKVESNYLVKYFDNFKDVIHFFMVFEFCKNGDLEKVIKTCKNDSKKIDVEKIKNWTLDILDGLDFLHSSLRVVHFDLKPANIFLGELHRCKIGDLGLVRNYESLSKISEMRGTLCYMSPELVNIQKTSKIDYKTDIWSFGCLLYEMVTLEKAFFHENFSTLVLKIVEGKIKIPENVDDVLKEIIKLCIVKEKKRKHTCKDFSNKLRKHSHDLNNSIKSNLINLEPNSNSNKINSDLYIKIGNDYYGLGDYNSALWYYNKSLEMTRKLFMGDHQDIATSLNNVGGAYEGLGDYNKALNFYNESLEMRRKLFTKDHPDIATSLNNVGGAYEGLGDYNKALRFHNESLEMTRRLFTEDHPNIATSLNNVGSAFEGLGDYNNALRFYNESLEMKRKLFTGDNPSIATSLNNVGGAYYALGDYNNALRFYNESLQMRRKFFSENHPDVLSTNHNIFTLKKKFQIP